MSSMQPVPRGTHGRRRLLVAALGGAAAALVVALAGCGDPTRATPPEPVPDVPYEPVDRAAALAEINAYRLGFGLPPVAPDPALDAFTDAYVRRLAALGVMTHQPTWFEDLRARLSAAGYGHRHAVEDLGRGQRRFQDVLAAWKKSPSHDKGLRDPDVTRMGIASFENPNEQGDVFWSLVMARP